MVLFVLVSPSGHMGGRTAWERVAVTVSLILDFVVHFGSSFISIL